MKRCLQHKRFVIGVLAVVFLSFATFLPVVFADETSQQAEETVCPAEKTCLPNPIGAQTIPGLVRLILKGILGIVGAVALIIFIYGGFTWMTSQGEQKKVKQGWDTMTWGALGLALIFGSYIIVNFLLGVFLPSPPNKPHKPPSGSDGSASTQERQGAPHKAIYGAQSYPHCVFCKNDIILYKV